jgi:hypothetical protein
MISYKEKCFHYMIFNKIYHIIYLSDRFKTLFLAQKFNCTLKIRKEI